MRRSLAIILSGLLPLAFAIPAAAQQQSESYKFLDAIRKADGTTVNEMLSTPGSRLVDVRDRSTGETALHIVAKRGDATYASFLLNSKNRADPNVQDPRGNTPLMLAVEAEAGGVVDALVSANANVNLANSAGETPLIRAVQRRDLPMVRKLLTAGANPDQTDNVAGLSARDYARQDTRSPAILKVMNEKPQTKPRGGVAGPRL